MMCYKSRYVDNNVVRSRFQISASDPFPALGVPETSAENG